RGAASPSWPRWSQAGGRDSFLLRVADPATREKILAEMRDNLRRRGGESTPPPHGGRRGGASTLLLTGGALAGKTLKQIAAERGTPAVETALELIKTGGDLGVAS